MGRRPGLKSDEKLEGPPLISQGKITFVFEKPPKPVVQLLGNRPYSLLLLTAPIVVMLLTPFPLRAPLGGARYCERKSSKISADNTRVFGLSG